MKIFIILCFAIIGINSLSSVLDEQWATFKFHNEKHYQTKTEEEYRKEIFISNVIEIQRHDELYEQGLVSYKMKINQFADLTNDEINKIYNGFKASKSTNIKTLPFVPNEDDEAPEAIDWRELGAVTPVKNQLSCGSCWSFSTTGSLEGQLFLKTGNLTSISEQNLVDCSKEGGNSGCSGGLMIPAFQYIIDNNGIDSEESYPYEAVDGDCRYDPNGNVTSAVDIVSITAGSEDDLKIAVATIGPVAVAIDASHAFSFYSEGIYYEEKCLQGFDDIDELTHAVLVVGYGTDENGLDYWLVKNSWGGTWGDEGYIKMSRNRDNNCGIATYACYPIL